LRRLSPILALSLCAASVLVAGCASQTPEAPPPAAAPAVVPTLPSAYPAQDLIGRWGLAAYHNPEDRQRTETAARNGCRQPYVITAGPTGGIMMHLADQATPSELVTKGAPGGKNYVGPRDEPPGSNDDREILEFTGQIMILRWMDPEVQSRYGTMVYVRCGAEGTKPAVKRKTSKPKPKPATPPPPKQ
jgi:hypothetical protein